MKTRPLMRYRSRICAFALIACAATIETTATSASAAEPASSTADGGSRSLVHIERSGCNATPLADVVAVLRVELGAQLVDEPVRGHGYDVSIDCTGDHVAIDLASARYTKAFETNLAGAPPSVRSRIVALAIAEIVRDLDREPPPKPVAPPPPPPAPIMPPPDRDQVTPPPKRNRPVQLGAFAQGSAFPLHGAWLGGGGVRFDYAYRRVCAGFDGVVLTSNEQFDIGTAQILLTYGSPYVAWRETWGALQTRLGLGYAIGAAKVSGRAEGASSIAGTITGVWSAPYAFAAPSLALTDALRLDLRAQLGWVTLPVVGDVSRADAIALKGAWASAQIGLALAL